MKIGILGAGHVGKALGDAWARHQHEVKYGDRGTVREAVEFGDVIVLAVPYQAALDIVAAVNLDGKIVVDCTNARSPVIGSDGKVSSGAEAILERARGARLVKAFNTTGANNMERPDYPGGRLAMLFCGDDSQAKKAVEGLILHAGFEPYDLGPLSNARLLEAQAELWIWLAFRGGLGRDFGFRLVRR